MGTALAHMLRADTEATDTSDSRTVRPAIMRPLSRSPQDQDGPTRRRTEVDQNRSARQDQNGPEPGTQHDEMTGSSPQPAGPQVDQDLSFRTRKAEASQ